MSVKLSSVWIYFENGTFLKAKSFGVQGERVGEAVFNTSMTGYQEIATDPSYAGQFVVFTMPEIGIVGTNEEDMESQKVHANGIIVRNLSQTASNFRSQNALAHFMSSYNAMGICDVDTRYLTKMLRDEGSMMMIASTKIKQKEQLKNMLENAPRIEEINYAKLVSTRQSYKYARGEWDAKRLQYKKSLSPKKRVVVIDFGVKKAILDSLSQVGIECEVVHCDFDPQELIKRYETKEIHGVFLSNGPGEPLKLQDEAKKIGELVRASIPMFGICLGHQLLSIANGHPTYKLKFGQHGGNHPVFDTKTKKVEITAQNHNYNVPKSIESIADITHYNLFDGTIEGVSYKNKSMFSVQHHPEASPGPQESRVIFQRFYEML